MPINPASIQSVRYQGPQPRVPSFLEGFAGQLAQGFGAQATRRAEEEAVSQKQLANLLPYFVQQGQLGQTPEGQRPDVSVGGRDGLDLTFQQPTPTPQDLLAGARTAKIGQEMDPTRDVLIRNHVDLQAKEIYRNAMFTGKPPELDYGKMTENAVSYVDEILAVTKKKDETGSLAERRLKRANELYKKYSDGGMIPDEAKRKAVQTATEEITE